MTTMRIAFFSVLLNIIHFTVVFLVTIAVGVDEMGKFIIAQHLSLAVVTIGFFTYTSWAYPVRPYFTALAIGILSILIGSLIGIAGFLLTPGYFPWEPAVFLIDTLLFVVAILVGVSLGSMLNDRRS